MGEPPRSQRPGRVTAGEVHGWFYAPTNPLVERVETDPLVERVETDPLVERVETDPVVERVETDSLVELVETPVHPPLIVISHGGPTAFSTGGFDHGVQFWTTRGFAVLDVNYRGSSGYGRAYRDRLRGQMGRARRRRLHRRRAVLADAGRVDGARLVIRGGSAGGYTTLRALTTSHRRFAAGCSRYGIGDLSRTGDRHAQVRVALPRRAGRPLPGGVRGVPRSARRSTTWTAVDARC